MTLNFIKVTALVSAATIVITIVVLGQYFFGNTTPLEAILTMAFTHLISLASSLMIFMMASKPMEERLE